MFDELTQALKEFNKLEQLQIVAPVPCHTTFSMLGNLLDGKKSLELFNVQFLQSKQQLIKAFNIDFSKRSDSFKQYFYESIFVTASSHSLTEEESKSMMLPAVENLLND